MNPQCNIILHSSIESKASEEREWEKKVVGKGVET